MFCNFGRYDSNPEFNFSPPHPYDRAIDLNRFEQWLLDEKRVVESAAGLYSTLASKVLGEIGRANCSKKWKDREAVIAREMQRQGFSQAQIADYLGCSVSTVKRRLKRLKGFVQVIGNWKEWYNLEKDYRQES